jgi:hypothetical protein
MCLSLKQRGKGSAKPISQMKALIILGALVGFLIGSGFGLAGHGPWPETLWRSCAAALVAAFLTRWWSQVWLTGLRESLEHRRKSISPSSPLNIKPVGKGKV